MIPQRRCAFVDPEGKRCAATAMQGGHDFCYSHREYITVSRNRTAGDAERPTEEPWAAREQEDRERRRRANAAAWYAYHERMREMHARLAEEHEAAALALLGGEEVRR